MHLILSSLESVKKTKFLLSISHGDLFDPILKLEIVNNMSMVT
jgi:hypothetical protein